MNYSENTQQHVALVEPQSLKLTLFPNPTPLYFELRTEATLTEVEILNASGDCIMQIETPCSKVVINHLAAGIYFVKAWASDGCCATERLHVL